MKTVILQITTQKIFGNNYDFDYVDDFSPELDEPVTIAEVQKAIQSLKRGKSVDNDFLMNGCFLESSDILRVCVWGRGGCGWV